MKAATGALYLDALAAVLPTPNATLLEIGCGHGEVLVEARRRGYRVSGIEISPHAAAVANTRLGEPAVQVASLETAALPRDHFDAVLAADVIEHVRDPKTFLLRIRDLLRPGGVALVITPSLDSWTRRLLRRRWMEYKVEHLYYFSAASIRLLLDSSGFEEIRIAPSRKVLTLDYLARHFERFRVPLLSPLLAAVRRLMPDAVAYRHLRIPASGLMAMARKPGLQTEPDPGGLLQSLHARLPLGAPLALTVPRHRLHSDPEAIQLLLLRHGFRDVLVRAYSGTLVTAVRGDLPARPKCSIIMAAFNESRSFPILMDALLKKELAGVDREIIIVESNSTDGTRELAKQYENHPEVKLVLQDQPRGKGHAIREGFRHATGDIILIQDADLEYDLDDYDALLAPILAWQALFVLGTRHAGDWKLRKFAGQKSLSAALNFGHVFFTGLINVLFRQHMTDPFTMFKVFRRDCLFGLEFSCNRFDFDHELVIKLVRKGYVPLEIPVNYASRSFREGKKVRLFRDPFTWLWIDLKLRFTRLYPKNLA